MSSVVFKSVDREKIDHAVNGYVKWLRDQFPEIQRIIWFGSWINGLPSPGSDVDLCLIVSKAGEPRHQRVSKYLPLGFPAGIDIVICTQEEFTHLKTTSPGMYQAILSGKDI